MKKVILLPQRYKNGKRIDKDDSLWYNTRRHRPSFGPTSMRNLKPYLVMYYDTINGTHRRIFTETEKKALDIKSVLSFYKINKTDVFRFSNIYVYKLIG